MKLKIGMICVCLLASLVLLNVVLSAEKETNSSTANPFAGKIVTLFLNGAKVESGAVLENAEIKDIGGQKMLVGIGFDTGDESSKWYAGVSTAVAWDSVAIYYILTKEEYLKKAEEFRNK